MNKKQMIVTLTLLLALLITIPASAIAFGWEDGDDHPYVGLMVADVDGKPAIRCSGTLIAPTVFLTAGHCTAGFTTARVWFDTDLTDNTEYPYSGETSIEGTPIAHPEFTWTFPQSSDVGVVILNEPVTHLGYGALPAIGLAETLNTAPGVETLVNIVGYGYQQVKPEIIKLLIRYQATPMLVGVNDDYAGGWNIHLTVNPGIGSGVIGIGGACLGDSGGPALASTDSNVVLGVGSFILNSNSRGAVYFYRVDTEHAQDFINQFMP